MPFSWVLGPLVPSGFLDLLPWLYPASEGPPKPLVGASRALCGPLLSPRVVLFPGSGARQIQLEKVHILYIARDVFGPS